MSPWPAPGVAVLLEGPSESGETGEGFTFPVQVSVDLNLQPISQKYVFRDFIRIHGPLFDWPCQMPIFCFIFILNKWLLLLHNACLKTHHVSQYELTVHPLATGWITIVALSVDKVDVRCPLFLLNYEQFVSWRKMTGDGSNALPHTRGRVERKMARKRENVHHLRQHVTR